MQHALEESAQAASLLFPELSSARPRLARLGNHGGFSGAALWRADTAAGAFCLRAWPAGMTTARLAGIHASQTRAARAVTFVPRLLPVRSGQTWATWSGRLWEACTWMPGVADFHRQPTDRRLRAAMAAVAELHRALGGESERRTVSLRTCPAVRKRVDRLAFWQAETLRYVERDVVSEPDDLLRPWVRRAVGQLRRWRDAALTRLESVPPGQETALQPCLCDLWHDHVLFVGDHVSGIVDFGAAAEDTPAVDLARLFGSFLGDDHDRRRLALAEYARHVGVNAPTCEQVELLDWTGIVVGTGNWLRWLYLEGRKFESVPGVLRRLVELVTRLEGRMV